MSYETTFNQETREQFKSSINYSALVARRFPEKKVHLEWHKSFQKIVDENNTVWEVDLSDPSLGHLGEGELRATLKSLKGTAIMVVKSLDGEWKQRLDYLVWTKSLTNRAEVNLQVVPGIDDIYLIPKGNKGISSTAFLYGNLYVSIKQWDAGDIDSLAKAIYQLVKDNSQIIGPESRACFKATADKYQFSIGDVISIRVEGLTKHWDSQWIYNQPREMLGEEVKYLERKENVFLFKALKPGKIKIPFAALNKQTLYVETQEVDIEIQ